MKYYFYHHIYIFTNFGFPEVAICYLIFPIWAFNLNLSLCFRFFALYDIFPNTPIRKQNLGIYIYLYIYG